MPLEKLLESGSTLLVKLCDTSDVQTDYLNPSQKIKTATKSLKYCIGMSFLPLHSFILAVILGQLRSGQCFEPDKPLFWSSPVATDSDDLSESNECFNNSLTQFVTFETL